MLALGIAAAVGASLLYNTSIALQALEAREVPAEHSLRPSLLGRLLRNRRWLGATALGLLGWPLEIVALLLAPLTVVQPCLASGLIAAALAGGDEAGGDAGAAGVRRGGGDRRRGRRRRLGGAGSDAPTTPAPAAIALALVLVAIPIARCPTLLRSRDGARRLGLLAVAQRRLRLRLDRDRQQAADRRARGRHAARRGRSGSPRRPPRRAWRC